MKTPLLPSETVIKDGPASMARGIGEVGGRLYLTNHRLVFEPGAFNLDREHTIIPLPSIDVARKCWSRFLNLIPILPTSVAVATIDEKEYRFVTFDREAWIEAIDRCARAPQP